MSNPKISVIIPNILPWILKTFVAPIFLEPEILGSVLPKSFEKTKPNGIEPIK